MDGGGITAKRGERENFYLDVKQRKQKSSCMNLSWHTSQSFQGADTDEVCSYVIYECLHNTFPNIS